MPANPFAAVPAALPPRAFAAVRATLFVLAVLPFVELLRLGFTGGLGANPVEFVQRWLGTWTLNALLATLAITPLRWLTGWAWLVRLRRMLGLYAFFYGTLHVTAYVWIDHFFDWTAIVDDVLKRPYLTFGFAAYVLMIPLAATSTNAMVRRLGGRNWQRLHRLVYATGVLGVLHFWYHKLAKNDLAEPTVYALVLGALLGARLLRRMGARSVPAAAPMPRQGRRDSAAKS
ncbi:MAG: protein-methionine-sulfoxide reductase heme-binding subunit MsrQ [Burkholderiaceae bacterium]